MIYHFNLAPTVWHGKPWVFTWDDEAGTVSGPDAEEIRTIAAWGGVDAHPYPWGHEFSDEPLKNKTDMAAIIGWDHVLPPELADHYPQPDDGGWPEKSYYDEKTGVYVMGLDQMVN